MRFLTRAALALMVLSPLACSAKDGDEFLLGQHYREVRTVLAPTDPKRIEVAEAFWYGCPHCFQFEPTIDKWLAKKPADVDFVRLPSSLGRPAGILHSKAFYAAEMLGVTDKIHKPLFGAMHGQGKMMATPEEIRAFFAATAGVKAEDFDGAFTGFAVDSRVRRAESLLKDYGITAVPTVIVGGKYYTYGSLAGNHENMLRVIDFLVAKVRKERGSK